MVDFPLEKINNHIKQTQSIATYNNYMVNCCNEYGEFL